MRAFTLLLAFPEESRAEKRRDEEHRRVKESMGLTWDTSREGSLRECTLKI